MKRLYVSTDGGYVRALDSQALDLVVSSGRQIEVRVHHLYCADDSRDCRYRFDWNGDAGRLEPVWTSGARPMGEGTWPVIDPKANDG